ncbi:hypothetical protein [Nocardioides sp.]|uniref:hypothetical protein n=1 Tax=Nocardioides sp. TaxID=35761 RepID=UPI00351997DB
MPAPAAPTVRPAPPLTTRGLPWHRPVDDAVAEIAAARRECGDTFALVADAERYLFTFSPVGVASFYALREEEASKGVADWSMLRRKLPDRIFADRRTLPGTLFRRDDVAGYLTALEAALDHTEAELEGAGTVDAFALTRRLGHRLGLACWAGEAATRGAVFDRLVACFDALDGADAFVHPDAMAAVAASGRAAEEAALEEIVDLVAGLPVPADGRAGLFGRIRGAWDDAEPTARRTGVGLDVALLHVASMSNLHAALGWALVDLLEHPDEAARVAPGDAGLAARAALESTRLAQRSIMARTVLAPIELDDGTTRWQVPPGWTVATLLPLLADGLPADQAAELAAWRPQRWDRHRVASPTLADPQLVTAFGHGRHTCPAQPFALTAMATSLVRLLGAHDLEPGWTARPRPVPAQIGGVARTLDAAPIHHRHR